MEIRKIEREIQEIRIYVLVLNTFGAAEEGEIVAVSDDYTRLVDWYNQQFNPEGCYMDGMWNKTFKKGSSIEWNNPCSSLELNDTYPFGHGIHDEWIPMETFYSIRSRCNFV